VLLVRDCLFVVPKYAYFAAGLYILEAVSLSATWDAGGSRQLCSGNLQPVPPEFDLYLTPGNLLGVGSEGYLLISIVLDHIKIFMA